MRPARQARRTKRTTKPKPTPARPVLNWAQRHEADRDEADEAVARRLMEDRAHG